MPDEQLKPDLLAGVALDDIPASGLLAGMVGERDAVLVRDGESLRAVGAKCTHLGAPLAKGLLVGGELRCPWHHACFDARTGRATKAPAFDPLPVWPVAVEGGRARVTQAQPLHSPREPIALAEGPFVVVGGGAAGYAAAVALKEGAPRARVTVLSADPHAPYDRTILSKGYLDGQAGDEKLPISKIDLAGLGVELRLSAEVERVDPRRREVVLKGGEAVPYAKLLLATGAEPKRPDVPGAERGHVLRDLDDCRAILCGIDGAKLAVVLGSSFIGLEAAAALTARGIAVTVVSPEEKPTAGVFGEAVSEAVMAAHRGKGVAFRLGREAKEIGEGAVTLDDGAQLPADLVVVGVGVKPRTALAEAAGLDVGDGVVVDAHLRTSDPDVFAAGDIARWPDPHSGRDIRVEHWVVAERQGQVAAANMLGHPTPFDAVPFFWSKHYDLQLRYVGHAAKGGGVEVEVEGSPAERDAIATFARDGRIEAVATIGRDVEALKREAAMEEGAAGRTTEGAVA